MKADQVSLSESLFWDAGIVQFFFTGLIWVLFNRNTSETVLFWFIEVC